jgi:hypothetical protein
MLPSKNDFKPVDSTNQAASAGHRSKRVKWIATICLIPMVLFGLFLCYLGYREAMAYRELNDKLESIRQAGEPIDDASMAVHYERTTHKEGTAAWTEALELVRSANPIAGNPIAGKLPVVGEGSLPHDFRPGVEWPDEPRVAEFLREVRPLINKIYVADAFPKPVWMPIEFDGYFTSQEVLQSTRSLARILELDMSHALFHKEGERALRGIRSLQSVANAFDSEISLVTKMITTAIQSMHKDSINRSLAMDVWNDEQLAELSEQARQPYDVPKAWKSSFVGERALAYTAVRDSRSLARSIGDYNNPLYLLPILPSGKLAFLRAYDVALDASSASTSELVSRATVAEKKLVGRASADFLVGLLFPALSSYAEAFDRDEVFRRLTVTSLAVKRFQLLNKQFPKNLPELADIGLMDRDWTTTNRDVFGYEVENEIAYVWTYGTTDKKTIPRSRPILPPDLNPGTLWNVVTIR